MKYLYDRVNKQEHNPLFREESNTEILSKERFAINTENIFYNKKMILPVLTIWWKVDTLCKILDELAPFGRTLKTFMSGEQCPPFRSQLHNVFGGQCPPYNQKNLTYSLTKT